MKYWTYICSTRYTPFGSILAGGPPGVNTTSFTGLPLMVTSRPPTWNDPMSLSWIGACAQAVRAASAGSATRSLITHSPSIRSLPMMPSRGRQRNRSACSWVPAVGPDAEHALRRFADDAPFQCFVEVSPFHYFHRLRIADRKRLIRAEHDALRRCFLREVFERVRVEHARVEIHRCEALARIGVLALRDLMVACEAPQRIGQRRPAVREHELHAGKPQQMSGKQEPRHRDRGVGQAPDGVDEVVVREPRLTTQEHRVHEHRGAQVGGRLPERVERGIVEVAAYAIGQRADHHAPEALLE